jgi:O-methyltransferase
VYLCDTFTGMTAPTVEDTSEMHGSAIDGERAWEALFEPEVFGREQVEMLLASTGYPRERVHFVVGPVEETLPTEAPDRIAVLRLDTDWYQSTRHELDQLYPRLTPGGVLLVDDYGHWDGARRAVEEYFDETGDRPLFARTDYSGRMSIKW